MSFKLPLSNKNILLAFVVLIFIGGIIFITIKNTTNKPISQPAKIPTEKISFGSSINFNNKELGEAVANYLTTQEHFVWVTQGGSKHFCVVENLGSQENFPLYVWALCEEYVAIDGILLKGSGISTPVKIYYSGQSSSYDLTKFSYEAAKDSTWSEDLKRIFPQEILAKISNVDIDSMDKENKAKAAAYFQVKNNSNEDNPGYKTYKNSTIGIEFQYPISWPALPSENMGDTMKDGKTYNSFMMNLTDLSHLNHTYMNYDNLPIDEQYEKIKCQKNNPGTIACENRVSSNGAKYVWEIEKTLGGPNYQAMVATGKYILIFDFQDKENYDKRADEYQKMLLSLKIVE